jgi:hypothetical protein
MSQRSKQISQAIEKSRRAKKRAGKASRSEDASDRPSSIGRVTLSSDHGSVTLIPVREPDWPICIIGLELLEKAVKAARKALVAVALDPELVARREAECSAILEGMRSDSPAIKLGLNVDWLPTLRAGLSLEFDQTSKLAENQEQLRLDPDETQVRIRQLDRLMSELDVAGMAGSGA